MSGTSVVGASIFPAFCAGLACIAVAAAPPVEATKPSSPDYKRLLDGYDLAKEARRGRSRIRATPASVRLGGRFTIEETFANTGENGFDVFNVSLDRRIPVPAVLAIYDEQRAYIGDLRAPVGPGASSSKTGLTLSDWCHIGAGESRTLSYERTAGMVGYTKYAYPQVTLPPGDYYVQMVYLDFFASSCPWHRPANPCGGYNGVNDPSGNPQLSPKDVTAFENDNPDEVSKMIDAWMDGFDGSELLRSNVVKITFE